jgi:hypothetical protein
MQGDRLGADGRQFDVHGDGGRRSANRFDGHCAGRYMRPIFRFG